VESDHTQNTYVSNIRDSGLDIYAPISVGDPDLWIPTADIQFLLNRAIQGLDLDGFALRTRSKVVKTAVCEAMGYTAPTRFRRTRPRFLGQCLDVYVQKSPNLQIWNEDIAPSRRYAVVKVCQDNRVEKVRVISGDVLARLDTTGRLTSKFQARIIPGKADMELVAESDTDSLTRLTADYTGPRSFTVSPTSDPVVGQLMPIRRIYELMMPLVGSTFADAGLDQERNRGGILHEQVCAVLGYEYYEDKGTFPDIRHQLVEVKLQTSPTIDLGLVSPDSLEPLDMPRQGDVQVRHCDVRYVVFCAERASGEVRLTKLYVSTGERFFTRFVRFGGLVVNSKLQIPLPRSFFDY
jgi:hypothetical protein